MRKNSNKVIWTKANAEFLSQICGVLKKHFLNLQKDAKRQKNTEIRLFPSSSYLLADLRVYSKPTFKMLETDKIPAECINVPGYSYFSKRNLCKWSVKLEFCYKDQNKKNKV